MFRLIGSTLVQVVALLSLWGGLYILIGSTSVGNVVVRLLLRMLGDNYFTVLPGLVTAYMLIPVAGVAFLVYRPVAKATEYLDQLVNSVDTLLQDDDTLIQLPADLQSVEVQLNGLKQRALRNAQVAAQAEQRKNDMVVYLAHDIRTPLTSIIGYLSLLNDSPDLPPDQRAKYVNVTLEKAYRLEELVNEFFEITRFNLQTIVLQKQQINLTHMLAQMADEFHPLLAPEDKRIVVTAPDDLVVRADPDKLSRVFNNILKNAVSYSPAGSEIHIAADRQEEQGVTVRFTNRGNPIPPEKLALIFEKFYRLDQARSSQTGGAGLGLAIAKEIVAAHGGTIEATSDEEETVFTVTLP